MYHIVDHTPSIDDHTQLIYYMLPRLTNSHKILKVKLIVKVKKKKKKNLLTGWESNLHHLHHNLMLTLIDFLPQTSKLYDIHINCT